MTSSNRTKRFLRTLEASHYEKNIDDPFKTPKPLQFSAEGSHTLQYLVDKMITHILLRPAGDAELDADDGRPMSPLQDGLLAPSNSSSRFSMDDSDSDSSSEEPLSRPRAHLDEKLCNVLLAERAIAQADALGALPNPTIGEETEEESVFMDASNAFRPKLLAELGDAAAALKPL